ncbi:MFS transporter [Nocardiopsis terrae]|uniref:MFS family permease n=1 Tax=Nocardiopsis terrae TaxID=372655 RepID=A0ABR9HP91_9ACTN|nr:MFS transporter [Nocardiopsis terrae]MBE1460825.1 MFS family permease [Nocardiopsis terrae]GHC73674.1 MFS transporter [Nocardiopsis terrae]
MTDRTPSQAAPLPPDPVTARASWSALAIVGIAQMLVMLDSTIVNVALPSIGRDLRAGTTALQWTISGYLLTYGALLLFGGRLADALGRRRALLLGLVLFGAASLVCGVAATEAVLVAARLCQGAGAAVLSASALSVIVSVYGRVPAQLNTALAVWSGLGVIGAVLGVVLGGVVVEYLSWRWAFLVNIPVVVAVVAASFTWLAPMPGAAGTRLRLPAAAAATLGTGMLCFGLIELQEGLSRPWPWAALASSAVLLTLLLRHQDRSADPLLPVFLLRTPAYAWAGLGLLLAATLMLGALYLSSNHLQAVHRMSPLETGFALLPLCLGSLVSAFAVPGLAARIGMTRVHLAGVLVQAASIAVILAGTASGTGGAAVVIAALAVFGLGLPTMFVPLYTFGSAPIPVTHAGVGSGLLNTFNESGAGVGLAVVAPVSAAAAAVGLDNGDSAPTAAAAGTHAGFWVLAAVSLLAGVVALALGRTAAGPGRSSGAPR